MKKTLTQRQREEREGERHLENSKNSLYCRDKLNIYVASKKGMVEVIDQEWRGCPRFFWGIASLWRWKKGLIKIWKIPFCLLVVFSKRQVSIYIYIYIERSRSTFRLEEVGKLLKIIKLIKTKSSWTQFSSNGRKSGFRRVFFWLWKRIWWKLEGMDPLPSFQTKSN